MGSNNQYKGYTDPDSKCPLCYKQCSYIHKKTGEGKFDIICSVCKKKVGTSKALASSGLPSGDKFSPNPKHII